MVTGSLQGDRDDTPNLIHLILFSDLHHLAMVRQSTLCGSHQASLPIQVSKFHLLLVTAA